MSIYLFEMINNTKSTLKFFSEISDNLFLKKEKQISSLSSAPKWMNFSWAFTFPALFLVSLTTVDPLGHCFPEIFLLLWKRDIPISL